MYFPSVKELIRKAREGGTLISTVVIETEADDSQRSTSDLLALMEENWQVMLSSMEQGLREGVRSRSGLTGGDGWRLIMAGNDHAPVSGGPMLEAVARSLAVAEVNASMGKIVAAPTAGSCGVLPAVG